MKAKQPGIPKKPPAKMTTLLAITMAMMIGGAAGFGLCTFLNAKGAF